MNSVNRLYELFAPTNYNISLTFDRAKRTFRGTVSVDGVAKSTDPIRLHSKGLSIESVLYDGKNAEFSEQPNDELVIAHADHEIGKHIIVVTFSGTITDTMHGLYPCYYEDDKEKKELLATQFESHHAREVFPCVDEPEAKAIFDLTLTTELDVTVLGNMPIKFQRQENEMLVTTFQSTPVMSSYLLAWVIGDLHNVTRQTSRGVDVSIWATPAQPAASLEFALDIAVRSIEFYEEYFQTEYPLPKSDHVALPDFSSGAMENWGLITYREVALLADPKITSVSSKRYIAMVVAHELAHQWFGNLVTMRWWNDLWLNESFATMMEYLAIDTLEPSWNMWLEFSSNENILALRRDSIDGVQPVQIDVHHPDEISTLFDSAIVYAKGARLLRMLQHYVGNEDFQAGLKHYFKDFAYQNTEASNLWDAIAKSSGKDIGQFMNTWLSQPGYPVVHVEVSEGNTTLRQEQFFVGPHQPSTRLWPVPLDSSSESLPELFDKQQLSASFDGDTLRLNLDDSAHFITHYDSSSSKKLIELVANNTLVPLARLQLLHESTLLARSGILPSADLIQMINAYKNETSEPVWGILSLAVGELRKFVETHKDAETALRQLSLRIAEREYDRLGWEAQSDESEDDTKLRATILSLVLYGELPEAIKKAEHIYQNSELEDIDAELRPLLLSSVVRHGNPNVVDDLMRLHAATPSADLRLDISSGVTSSTDPEVIKQLLESLKDQTIVRRQDVTRWFVYLVRAKESREFAWKWMRNNWEWIEATFSGDKSYDNFPRYVAGSLTTKQHLDEYKAFFGPMQEVPALSRAITMGISEIEGRVELIERDGKSVIQALLALQSSVDG